MNTLFSDRPPTPPSLPSSPPNSSSPQQHSSHIPPTSTDRDRRLERAVALVTNSKYSVRKAAHALSLPKSTVHRYLQATRSAPPHPNHPAAAAAAASSVASPPPASASAAAAAAAAAAVARVAKRPRSVRRKACMGRPPKCELAFLLQGKDGADSQEWDRRLRKSDDVGGYYEVQRSNLRRIWA